MAGEKVTAPNELAQLQGILGILGGGGQTTTSTPTNTAPLQGVLGQLQGTDYNALLQSIFQQAAGQIPGMQAAYGRAVGARSSGNAPMQAALQELMKQTTLAGQQQIATQQNQNLATQAQAASNLRGTQQKTSQNSQLGQLASIIGLAQAATKLGGYKTVQEMFSAVTGAGTGSAVAPAPQTVEAPQMSLAPTQSYNLAADVGNYSQPTLDLGDAFSEPGGMSQAPADFMPTFNLADLIAPQDQPTYDMSLAPEEWFQSPDVMSYF